LPWSDGRWSDLTRLFDLKHRSHFGIPLILTRLAARKVLAKVIEADGLTPGGQDAFGLFLAE
jgi:hypothetical protein